MLILNTGGTLNKKYNKINSELEVPFDNNAIEKILSSSFDSYSLAGVVYKDSLEIDNNDRKTIANILMESDESVCIIVHGTDTMHLTAEFLDEIFYNKLIILTGAMKPFEIDSIESTLNLGIALGFAKAKSENGVFICMSGIIELWNNIKKNKSAGKFEIVK